MFKVKLAKAVISLALFGTLFSIPGCLMLVPQMQVARMVM